MHLLPCTLPVSSVSPSPGFCPEQRPLLFFGTQWGSPAPRVLIPAPGTPWLVLSRPTCNIIIPGFLTLEEIQSTSTFHTPCAELILLKKLYRKGIKMTICQLSKHQRHSLTLNLYFSMSCQLSSRGQHYHAVGLQGVSWRSPSAIGAKTAAPRSSILAFRADLQSQLRQSTAWPLSLCSSSSSVLACLRHLWALTASSGLISPLPLSHPFPHRNLVLIFSGMQLSLSNTGRLPQPRDGI